MDDFYKTITKPSVETLFKDRNSKFYGYAFPVKSEEAVKTSLEFLRKKHYSARHFCYAWQLGVESFRYRANDDGEPSNSAGMPIYGQIQSFELTNILVVSVRYFGGTKLGVSGLINAYRSSARLALESSIIEEKTIDIFFQLNFEYDLMSKVLRIIKENSILIQEQKLEMNCELIIAVRKSNANKIFKIFEAFYKVQIKSLEI
ncbi:MAG: YigZ family protein [Flavobacteriaceae bacterium]|nr:YigZ family protein [Flavobacteriaceae bacterium]MDG2444079.1 YigZ family protein [Flavobacteriaceae bacterium]